MNEYFTLVSRDGIAHLQLDRPERLNAMDAGFFPALREALRTLGDDPSVRALVISATGAQFGSGLDLEVFDELLPAQDDTAAPGRERRDPAMAAQREAIGALLKMLDTAAPTRARPGFQEALQQLVGCFDLLDEARFPAIAVVQGGCTGTALDLAAACDLRVCTADAFFAVRDAAIDVLADARLLQRLTRIVPPAVVREMVYTGDRIDAARALSTGLVNAVLADREAALEHAMALARRVAAGPIPATSSCKWTLNRMLASPPDAAVGAVDEHEVAQALAARRLPGGRPAGTRPPSA